MLLNNAQVQHIESIIANNATCSSVVKAKHLGLSVIDLNKDYNVYSLACSDCHLARIHKCNGGSYSEFNKSDLFEILSLHYLTKEKIGIWKDLK